MKTACDYDGSDLANDIFWSGRTKFLRKKNKNILSVSALRMV